MILRSCKLFWDFVRCLLDVCSLSDTCVYVALPSTVFGETVWTQSINVDVLTQLR